MKKEEVLKFISDTKAINECARNVIKEINKINPEKYWTVPEEGTFFVRFHEHNYNECSIVKSYIPQVLFDIPIRWLWTPIYEIKKEVLDELKEYLKIKIKDEIEDYEFAIKDFKNIKCAKNELEKLEDEEKKV
jgi:hypothetical protein